MMFYMFFFQWTSTYIPSLKLTAKTLKNGWLEDDPASFWHNLGLVSGAFAVTFREGTCRHSQIHMPKKITIDLYKNSI